MDILAELLKISIPAVVVAVTVVIIISRFFNNQLQMKSKELALQNRQISLPLRFQALERLVLLMERISIGNMLLRISATEMSVVEYKLELMQHVTHEFEHNLSQQLYVSNGTWQKIEEAKQYVLSTINATAESMDQNLEAQALIDALIFHITSTEITPAMEAIYLLKKEAESVG
ncbi:hypothetical protein GC194_01155 [bacterium]|nr:hypothetical protein [bacterium]